MLVVGDVENREDYNISPEHDLKFKRIRKVLFHQLYLKFSMKDLKLKKL